VREVVASQVKLGKKKGVVHDPRTFKLKKLLQPRKLPTPPEQSYVGKGEPIRMYANDQIGDCTFAAQAHRIDTSERSSRQVEIQLVDTDVIEAYAALTGYNPQTGANDNGAYMLDVNNYMRTIGMGREEDGSRHTIAAFAALDLKNHAQWKLASWMFGGVYFGAWLPWTAAEQLDAGRTHWRVDESDSEKSEPGSWGGHAMHAVGYSSGSIVLATWGQRLRATWDWVDKYVDEAYVFISEDFLRGDKTPQGFNAEKLQEALANL
jgi:hypothetical protein